MVKYRICTKTNKNHKTHIVKLIASNGVYRTSVTGRFRTTKLHTTIPHLTQSVVNRCTDVALNDGPLLYNSSVCFYSLCYFFLSSYFNFDLKSGQPNVTLKHIHRSHTLTQSTIMSAVEVRGGYKYYGSPNDPNKKIILNYLDMNVPIGSM